MKAKIKFNNDTTPPMWDAYAVFKDGREEILWSIPESFDMIDLAKAQGIFEDGTTRELLLESYKDDPQMIKYLTDKRDGFETITDALKEQGYELLDN